MSTNTVERPSAVMFRGTPMTLVGPALAAGDAAPDFTLSGDGLTRVSLADVLAQHTRPALLIVFPSLDTPTCSLETLTFQKRASELPTHLGVTVVSSDLPFAQARWASEHDAESFTYLSNYRDPAFGEAYGVLVREIGLLARALFVLDAKGRIAYAHVVPEIADEPDYDACIAAARAV